MCNSTSSSSLADVARRLRRHRAVRARERREIAAAWPPPARWGAAASMSSLRDVDALAGTPRADVGVGVTTGASSSGASRGDGVTAAVGGAAVALPAAARRGASSGDGAAAGVVGSAVALPAAARLVALPSAARRGASRSGGAAAAAVGGFAAARLAALLGFTLLAISPVAIVVAPAVALACGMSIPSSTLLTLSLAVASMLLGVAITALESHRRRAAEALTLQRRNADEVLPP